MAKYDSFTITRTKAYREAKKDLTKDQLAVWVRLATASDLVFDLVFTRELCVNGQFAVVGPEDFWMEALDTKEEAIELCQNMDWKFMDYTKDINVLRKECGL